MRRTKRYWRAFLTFGPFFVLFAYAYPPTDAATLSRTPSFRVNVGEAITVLVSEEVSNATVVQTNAANCIQLSSRAISVIGLAAGTVTLKLEMQSGTSHALKIAVTKDEVMSRDDANTNGLFTIQRPSETIRLAVGESHTLVDKDFDLIGIADPSKTDVEPTTAEELKLIGKKTGITTLTIRYPNRPLRMIRLVVTPSPVDAPKP